MSLCHARWVTRAANGVEDEDFSVPAGHIGGGEKKYLALLNLSRSVWRTLCVPGNNSVHVMG